MIVRQKKREEQRERKGEGEREGERNLDIDAGIMEKNKEKS